MFIVMARVRVIPNPAFPTLTRLSRVALVFKTSILSITLQGRFADSTCYLSSHSSYPGLSQGRPITLIVPLLSWIWALGRYHAGKWDVSAASAVYQKPDVLVLKLTGIWSYIRFLLSELEPQFWLKRSWPQWIWYPHDEYMSKRILSQWCFKRLTVILNKEIMKHMGLFCMHKCTSVFGVISALMGSWVTSRH